MFLLYHSERYNTSGTVFHWCYIRLAYYTMQWYAGSPHLAGGNFLGTPALEASCIIESLVGIPPVNEAKIEISLEDVMKKLEAIEKNLPSVETKLRILLDNTDKLDKSLGGINERIAVLETCAIHDNQTHRIGELEEAMGTLGSTFSSLKFKEKVYVGKEQKFMYVSKVPKPKKILLL